MALRRRDRRHADQGAALCGNGGGDVGAGVSVAMQSLLGAPMRHLRMSVRDSLLLSANTEMRADGKFSL